MNPSAVTTSIDRQFLLVVAFEYRMLVLGKTVGDRFGWAYSPNPGVTPFKVCRDDHSDCSLLSLPVATIPNHRKWLGSPSIAYDGTKNVVIVTQVDTTGDDIPDKIAAVVSHDGGKSFGVNPADTVEVNEADAGAGCDNGVNMHPTAAFDYESTPADGPLLHVSWLNKQHSNFGICYRTFFFNANNTLTPWNVHAQGVSNVHAQEAIIQASDGLATVGWVHDFGQNTTCGPGGPDRDYQSMTTMDPSGQQGEHWTDSLRVFDVSNGNQNQCPISNNLQLGFRQYDFIVATDGTAYYVLRDTPNTLRLFMSSARGMAIKGNTGAKDDSTWREFCGNHWNAPGQSLGNLPCPAAGLPFRAPLGQQLFNPTLASDELGNLLLTYVETDPTNNLVHVVGWRFLLPRSSATPPNFLERILLRDNFLPGIGDPSHWLGEYNDTASNSTARFNSYVAGCTIPGAGRSGIPPGPGLGGFYPVWVSRDDAPTRIETRLVPLL